MLQRLQQIQDLGDIDTKKKKSINLISEKLFSKVLSRVEHLDCEDMLQLVRYLAKVKLPAANSEFKQEKAKWVQDVMIEVTKRIKTPEFLQEIRLLYKFENWLSLMINVNLIYGNTIIASGCTL